MTDAAARSGRALAASCEERLGSEELDWLRETADEVRRDPAAIRVRFPMVGRKVGRGPLDPDADPADVHAWTIDDAARTVLLAALGDRVEDELRELYRYGDAAERRGLLRALPYLPVGDRARDLVDDAIRTNDTRLIAAALGPYATEHLDDAAYEQAVLKCVFVGVPIRPLDGLPERVTANGARMLAAFVLERVAAGRDVPAEVWDVIDRYPPEDELHAIAAELSSPFEDRRRAAEEALATRSHAEPNDQCRGAPNEDLRPARAHDVAHHRRLRGDGRRRRQGARRAGLLARPAAHLRRLVRRLLQLAARLGALQGRPVRHPPPLHDRAQPEGGERRHAAPRRDRRSCRASSPRTASSRSARSASTR